MNHVSSRQVCQLQLHQLQGMGVAQEHCEKILENVHVLRQTLIGKRYQLEKVYKMLQSFTFKKNSYI